jgi:hypothetical protein
MVLLGQPRKSKYIFVELSNVFLVIFYSSSHVTFDLRFTCKIYNLHEVMCTLRLLTCTRASKMSKYMLLFFCLNNCVNQYVGSRGIYIPGWCKQLAHDTGASQAATRLPHTRKGIFLNYSILVLLVEWIVF